MKLRPYQRDALTSVYGAWGRGVTRPAVVMATGMGKTVIFSALIARWCAQNPGGRVLVLVHRDELADQARRSIRRTEPGLEVGIVKGTKNEVAARVIVGGAQTLLNEARRDQVRGVGLIVVDECHHYAAVKWRTILDHFGAWAGVPTVGFTATMHREDGKGLGEIWQEVVITRDIIWGVTHYWDTVNDVDARCAAGDQGYLVKPRGLRVRVPQLHLERVKVTGGDFQNNQAAAALMNADTGPAIARALQQYAPRRRMAGFAPNVAACENFAEATNAAGFVTEVVTGKTPKHVRTAMYARFESGHTQILFTPMVLTEGWDAPHCDGVIVARPTKNPGLFQQMVGRCVRPHGDKDDALVLDVAGATDVANLASLADLGMDEPDVVVPRDPTMMDDLDGEELLDGAEDPYVPEVVTPEPVATVTATEVDWFGQSEYRWLTTRNGVKFLRTNTDVVFLWPEQPAMDPANFVDQNERERTYTVGSVPLYRRETATPYGQGLTEDDAGKIAQDVATELGYTHKSEAWRRKDATWAKIRELARFGIPASPSASAGEVQDAIDTAMAERKLGIA